MSPTVLRDKGYRLFFFSREEPRFHIHVKTQGGAAKFWLDPHLQLARNHGLTNKQIKEAEGIAEGIIEQNHDRIFRAWNEHFKS